MNVPPSPTLEGVTLETILTWLVEHYGWEVLGQEIRINCFQNDPSIRSSLKFLRRTPWARQKVELLYLDTVRQLVEASFAPQDRS